MVFVIRYDLPFYATGIQMVLTNTFTNELMTCFQKYTVQMLVMGLFTIKSGNCYMTPIKDLLLLAETSLHWL